jgi:hypothetical protein
VYGQRATQLMGFINPEPKLDTEQRRAISEAVYTLIEDGGMENVSYDAVIMGWRIMGTVLDGTLLPHLDEFRM